MVNQQTDIARIQPGTEVYGSDGDKIGDVAQVGPNYIVVEKGLLMPKDIYVPASAIVSVASDRVELSVAKDAVEDQNWEEPPAETAGPGSAKAGAERTDATLERHEERLQVDKQPEQTGEVRVGKQVVQEEQSVDVPVSREEVHVTSRSVDEPASGDAFQEEQVAVPVSEERVQVGKETRTVEELDVEKSAHQDTERVTDTVRREEFTTEEEGDVRRR